MSLEDAARARVSVRRAIDSACDRHEADWRSGGRPSLEERLTEVEEAQRPELARELVPIDAHYRRSRGESPQPSDYTSLPGVDLEWLRRAISDAAKAGPRRLGRFELIERLGAGGFGAVWKARDPELDRMVAVKVLHGAGDLTPEESARFLREARAAGSLRHPGIAAIFEATTLEGQPALVTELVEGPTLRDALKERAFTPLQAAALVADLADAVAYAHSMGVIHRDLKPANVLLDAARGRPVLVDFGLARREGADATLTGDGQLLGTPAYMSPEQASGLALQADPRSDVYGLGLILHEAASGAPAFRGEKLQVLEQVRRGAKSSPREARPAIPRDLETIILKATALEPAHRYASARELSDDLRRFAAGEAVHARRDSLAYVLWRSLRRHRVALFATLGIAILLAAFAVTVGVLAVKAQREAATAREVESFLTGLFEVADPDESHGADVTVKEMVRRGAESARTGLEDQPVVQGRLLRTLGGVQFALDEKDEARALLEESLAILERTLPEDDPEIARTANQFAMVLVSQLHFDEAEALARRALAIREGDPRTPPGELATSLHRLAEIAGGQKRHDESAALYARALALRDAADGPGSLASAADLEGLALVASNSGDLPGALAFQLQALSIVESRTAPDDPRVMRALLGVSSALRYTGRTEEALDAVEQALGLSLEIHGERSSRTADCLRERATLFSLLRRNEEAAADLDRALAIVREVEGDGTLAFARKANLLGVGFARAGCGEDAAQLYERTLAIQERLLPPDDPALVVAMVNLGERHAASGRAAEAERLFRRAVNIASRRSPPDPSIFTNSALALARMLAGRDRSDEALSLAVRIEESWQGREREGRPDVAAEEYQLGELYRQLGRPAQALPLLERSLETRLLVDGAASALVAQVHNALGSCWGGVGCIDAGAAAYRDSLAINLPRQGPAAPDVRSVSGNLALLLAEAGRGDEALPILERLLDGDMRHPSNDPLRLQAIRAAALAWAGRADEALALAREAGERARDAGPPDRRMLALRLVAQALARSGRADEGEAIARALVDEWEAAHGPDDGRLFGPLRAHAACLAALGRAAEADAQLARAAALPARSAPCP